MNLQVTHEIHIRNQYGTTQDNPTESIRKLKGTQKTGTLEDLKLKTPKGKH